MPSIAPMRVCSEKFRESAPLTEYQDATTPGIVSLYETAGNELIDSEIFAWNALLSRRSWVRSPPPLPISFISLHLFLGLTPNHRLTPIELIHCKLLNPRRTVFNCTALLVPALALCRTRMIFFVK